MTVHPVTRAVCCEWQSCIPYCLLRNFTWLFGFVFVSCLKASFSGVFAFSFMDFKYCFVFIFQCCEQLLLKELFGVNYYTIIFWYRKYIGFQILRIPKHVVIHMCTWALLGTKVAVLIPYPLFTSLGGLKGRWNFVFGGCCSTLSV